MDEMKTYFSNASKEKVYFWEYDDRSVTSLRFDTGCKDAREMKTFATLEKMRAYFNSGKKEEIQFKRCKIACGIDRQKHRVFSSVNPDKTVLEECFAELEKMIAAHSKNKDNTAMLSLFSWAMAGYISRLLISKMETPPLYFYRAPIIQIVGHKNDACLGFEYLQRIIESLYVDTSWSSKAVLNNPAVIPAYRSVDKIVDCAYLVMNKDQKKTPCDTQYRDTMVLLHPHFFEKEQCNKFINRNVWASIFLFNKKPDQSSTAIQRVDMNDMALPEWTWSPEKVNTLITGYVNWLSYIPCSAEYKRRWRFWNIAGEQILYYSELAGAAKGKRKLQGCEREYKLLQIKAIIALLDYCYITDVIDLDRQAQLVQNWIGGLFPGYPYQQLNLKKAEKQSDNETQENTRLLNEFKKLIKWILETDNGKYVKYLPPKAYCADSDILDIDNGPWAYLYWKEPKNKKGKKSIEPFRAVKIRKTDIMALCRHFGLLDNGQEFVILKSNITKNATENNYLPDEIDFIFGFINERFKFEIVTKAANNNPVEAVVLNLDKMTFLGEDFLKKFIEQFPPKP